MPLGWGQKSAAWPGAKALRKFCEKFQGMGLWLSLVLAALRRKLGKGRLLCYTGNHERSDQSRTERVSNQSAAQHRGRRKQNKIEIQWSRPLEQSRVLSIHQ